jgi:hypothetical protein
MSDCLNAPKRNRRRGYTLNIQMREDNAAAQAVVRYLLRSIHANNDQQKEEMTQCSSENFSQRSMDEPQKMTLAG